MRYDVNADLYEGPLNLLVELAKHNLLDVFLVKLQELTAQYRTWMKSEGLSLNELAEPLPLLGQLIALKSRGLLPQPPPLEEEEPPVSLEDLERRLREYEQFKTVAQVLAELHALQHEHFARMKAAASDEQTASRLGQPSQIGEVGLLDLMAAFGKVLERTKGVSVYEVQEEAWTVEMKVEELKMRLAVKRQIAFLELFSTQKTTLELVVTFLALLELVRQRLCMAIQERPFDEIVIVRREATSTP